MAGISATLSRADLKFMAEDIGPELVPFLEPEDMLKSMNPAKRRKFLSLFDTQQLLVNMSIEDRLAGIDIEDRLANISTEELIKGISPEQRKKLFESVLKMLAAGWVDKEE